jgi:hypothetical protein
MAKGHSLGLKKSRADILGFIQKLEAAEEQYVAKSGLKVIEG